MSVIVSKGNSPYKVSSGHTDSGDVVVSGGSMFVLSAGVANATTVSSGGFLTINKGGSGSGSFLLGGTETISGTETGDFIESGGSQRVLAAGKAISSTIESGGASDSLFRRNGERCDGQQRRQDACCRRRCRRRRDD